jgi:hypothetical protein
MSCNGLSPWLQIDHGFVRNISGLMTSGADSADNYFVMTYAVTVSNDGVTWVDVDGGYLFDSVTEYSEVKESLFNETVTARYVRLHPKTWNGEIGVRVSVAGLRSSSSVHNDTNAEALYGANMNGAISSSSLHGWRGNVADTAPWFQMDQGTVREVVGIVTQGGNGGWTKSFSVKVSRDVLQGFMHIGDFVGNSDDTSLAPAAFPSIVLTRFIRIYLTDWHSHPVIKAELMSGCTRMYKSGLRRPSLHMVFNQSLLATSFTSQIT